MNPICAAVARPIQPLQVADAWAETGLADFPLPAPSPAHWEHNLQTLTELRAIRAERKREAQDGRCITLAGPPHLPLEALLVAGLWHPVEAGFRAYNVKAFPRLTERTLAYLTGSALAVLLNGAGLTPDEERLRSGLALVTALFVTDLQHAEALAPPGTAAHKLLLALLLARRQGGRPWYVTWQGSQGGPLWSVLRSESRLLEIRG